MRSWILPPVIVAAMALMVITGCAPPPGTSDSNEAGGSSRNGAGVASNSSEEKGPPRIEPPADIAPTRPKKVDAAGDETMPSDSVDSPEPGAGDAPAGANESANDPKPASSGSGAGAASIDPKPTKKFKLEYVSASGNIGLNPGDTIPNIEGADLDGIDFQLSDYQGKVIMIDFWGDW